MTEVTNEYTLGEYKYKVKGYAVLVEIEEVKARSSVIIDPMMLGAEREKYLAARHTGYVRAMGELAYDDEGSRRCEVGDKVLFASYSGRDVNRKIDNRLRDDQPLLRIMTDKEIQCVIEDVQTEVKTEGM